MTTLTVEITQRCPNSCLFCSSVASPESQVYLSKEILSNLFSQASILGFQEIFISGGEPLVHPNFPDLVEILMSHKIDVILYTSGLVFGNRGETKPFLDWSLIRKIKKIVFNVQSIEENIHDSLTGHRGGLNKTLASIENSIRNGFLVEVHLVPNAVNLNSIQKTVCALAELGISKISFLRLVPQGYAEKNQFLSLGFSEMHTLKAIFNEISVKDLGKTKVRVGIPFGVFRSGGKKCNAGSGKILIRYDGKAFPCEAFKQTSFNRAFILGDICKNSLGDVLIKGREAFSLRKLKESEFSDSCPAQAFFQKLVGISVQQEKSSNFISC